MENILPLLKCLESDIGGTRVRQLSRITQAMLAMTGRVTMLGISRWTGFGGSYRTIQRFFYTALPWATLLWVFFRKYLWCRDETYLLAGDEVVVSKSGKKTHGLERFFSSISGKSIPGLSFFALSLVSVEQRHSFPVRLEQTLLSEEEKEQRALKAKTKKKKKKSKPGSAKNRGGRPRGSKTKKKTEVTMNPELLRIKGWIQALLKQLENLLPVRYLLLDGHFGNSKALLMARQLNLHLISKLRYDSALYLPYQNPDPTRKCRRKYGDKLSISNIPAQFLKSSNEDGNYRSDIYQLQLLHKEFAQPLNVVILVKTHQSTGSQSNIILFSSDLQLSELQLIDYYSLRFQIEFNFRDAKQFWGLEDFMNTSQTAVTSAANLSFFMVNLSHYLLKDGLPFHQAKSILDLKAICRGSKYVEEIVKLLPEKPEPVLLVRIKQCISNLGRIHHSQPSH